MKWGDLPLRVKGVVVLSLPGAVLLLNSLATYFLNSEQETAQRWVSHTLDVRVSLEHLLASASAASTTCSSYILNPERDYWDACERSGARLRAAVDELQVLTADNPVQQQHIIDLRRAVDERMRSLLAAAAQGSLDKAHQAAALVAQKSLFQISAAMDAEEASLLATRTGKLQAIHRVLSFVVPVTLFCGIAGGLIGIWLFLTGIARRISFLQENVTLLADERPIAIGDTCKDEIGAVASGLARTSELLRQRNSALFESHAQIAEERERAERASQMKSEFLARMSGEIRAPMNASRWMADLLSKTPLTEEQSEYVRVFQNNSERLLNLSNEILEWSKTQSEDTDMETGPVDLVTLLDKTMNLLGPLESLVHREKALHESNEQLAEERQRAEQASQTKSDFLACMSHEIRTPMNAICGMADLLWETPLSRQQREYVRVFRENSERLLNLINDILDLSKVEAGHVDLEDTDFDLIALLDQTIDLLGPLARRKGLDLVYTIKDEVPTTLGGDPDRLKQVLVNLVGNAIKFTESGEIKVLVERDPGGGEAPGSLRFQISDTGPGISPDQVGKIFEPFAQADVSMARKAGGTGLGLAITKRLIEFMGGTIWVESLQGSGTTFYFRVRFNVQPGRQPSARRANQSNTRAFIADKHATNPYIRAAKPTAAQTIKVLVADDSEDNRFLMKEYLDSEGFEVDFAENGLEAVQKATTRKYDLILMDVQMPQKDGYTATREIRAWEAEHGLLRVPIITVTAHAFKGEETRSFRAGSSAYLAKPISKGKLMAEIERANQSRISSRKSAPVQLSPGIQARVPAYLDRRREDVRRIPDLLQEDNFEAIRVLGHDLKGTGAGYGFPELGDLGAEIEKAAKAQDRARIQEHTASLQALLGRLHAPSSYAVEVPQ